MPTNRRKDLPAGWRRPPETTVEPVPAIRPYAPPNLGPLANLLPQRPRFIPRRRTPASGQPLPGQRVGGEAEPPPAPAPSRRVPAMRRWRPMRAAIGDQIRVPVLWCQFGDCIKRYASDEARGESDLRARAGAAGWRYDALGRLACPACAQHDPSFCA